MRRTPSPSDGGAGGRGGGEDETVGGERVRGGGEDETEKSAAKWSCPACTFANPGPTRRCECARRRGRRRGRSRPGRFRSNATRGGTTRTRGVLLRNGGRGGGGGRRGGGRGGGGRSREVETRTRVAREERRRAPPPAAAARGGGGQAARGDRGGGGERRRGAERPGSESDYEEEEETRGSDEEDDRKTRRRRRRSTTGPPSARGYLPGPRGRGRYSGRRRRVPGRPRPGPTLEPGPERARPPSSPRRRRQRPRRFFRRRRKVPPGPSGAPASGSRGGSPASSSSPTKTPTTTRTSRSTAAPLPARTYANLLEHQRERQVAVELHCQRAGGIVGEDGSRGGAGGALYAERSGLYRPSLVVCPRRCSGSGAASLGRGRRRSVTILHESATARRAPRRGGGRGEGGRVGSVVGDRSGFWSRRTSTVVPGTICSRFGGGTRCLTRGTRFATRTWTDDLRKHSDGAPPS